MSEPGRAPWLRPRFSSVSIPVVEELLAESYRKKADLWADAAGVLRKQREQSASDVAAAPAPSPSDRPPDR